VVVGLPSSPEMLRGCSALPRCGGELPSMYCRFPAAAVDGVGGGVSVARDSGS
jgi:hypothetical protein